MEEMLVPAMTLAELRKEVEKDFDVVLTKMYKEVLDLMAKKKHLIGKPYHVIKDYISENKNTWLYKSMVNEKFMHVAALVYFYNDTGLVAIERLPGQSHYMAFYTTHFFKRYNERLNLNIVKPREILHHYLWKHLSYNIKPVEEVVDGVKRVFGISAEGVLLGTYVEETKFFKMNTFLTFDMLKGSQVNEKDLMKELYDKHVKDADWT